MWIGGISLKRLISVFLIAFFLIILIVECIQFNIRGAKKIVEMKNISENISNQTKIMKIELNPKEGLIPRSLLRNKLFQNVDEVIY